VPFNQETFEADLADPQNRKGWYGANIDAALFLVHQGPWDLRNIRSPVLEEYKEKTGGQELSVPFFFFSF